MKLLFYKEQYETPRLNHLNIYLVFSHVNNFIRVCFVGSILLWSCGSSSLPGYGQNDTNYSYNSEQPGLKTGAERLISDYSGMISGKRVAVTGNHTSLVQQVHLIDTLLAAGVNIVRIFSPEHGFRGIAGAGEEVLSFTDERTGIPVISLYGSKRKPAVEDLNDIDIMIFDIQDVGVRFYTYISTLHYIMEACAENNMPVIITDRPNPNGNYIDGPVLEPEYQSFVGMHPVPLVHGMTIGEYGLMINGEGWLKGGKRCNLHVISCKNYSRYKEYILPVPPSPNLRSQQAIRLYPSIALFEGTVISEGRGTEHPFEIYGHPELRYGEYYFTPASVPAAMNPKLKGMFCRGEDLRQWIPCGGKWENIELQWLIRAYNNFPGKDTFFNNFFLRLAGTSKLYDDIRAGKNEFEIRKSWEEDLKIFAQKREKYLLYP